MAKVVYDLSPPPRTLMELLHSNLFDGQQAYNPMIMVLAMLEPLNSTT